MSLGRPLVESRFLSYMQTWVQGFDTDTAQILRRDDTTVDELGGVDPKWPVIATLPCRLVPAWKLALEQLDKTQGKAIETNAWYCKLPYGTQVLPQDRIQVGARVFEVTSSNAGRTFEIETIVQVMELQ